MLKYTDGKQTYYCMEPIENPALNLSLLTVYKYHTTCYLT